MCMSVCLPGLTNDSMLPQNIHHLSDVIFVVVVIGMVILR